MVDASVDASFMERALFLAERGRGTTSPNPMVGAVVVSSDGVVVGQGAHEHAGGPHAEVIALDDAGDRARGATLYCTLEPCAHTGRTGPCVERIAIAGIVRVVAAMVDPNPKVSGAGVDYLRGKGIHVTVGVGEQQSRRMNAPFITWITARRPFVTVKAAVSSDGFVGSMEGRRLLTGDLANRYFHQQRTEVDAIAVGAGTVMVDNPLLTARYARRVRPLTRVVFDWRLRVPVESRLFSTLGEGPVIMAVGRAAADAAPERVAAVRRVGAEAEIFEDRDIHAVLRKLAAREVTWLLVEGGPSLQQAFFDAGLVDRVQRIETSVTLGEGVPEAPGLLQSRSKATDDVVTDLGQDRLVEWDVHRTD